MGLFSFFEGGVKLKKFRVWGPKLWALVRTIGYQGCSFTRLVGVQDLGSRVHSLDHCPCIAHCSWAQALGGCPLAGSLRTLQKRHLGKSL